MFYIQAIPCQGPEDHNEFTLHNLVFSSTPLPGLRNLMSAQGQQSLLQQSQRNNSFQQEPSAAESWALMSLAWPTGWCCHTDAWCPKLRAALTRVCGTGSGWQDPWWSPVDPGTQLMSFQASQHPIIKHASNHYSYESMCSFCLHRG